MNNRTVEIHKSRAQKLWAAILSDDYENADDFGPLSNNDVEFMNKFASSKMRKTLLAHEIFVPVHDVPRGRDAHLMKDISRQGPPGRPPGRRAGDLLQFYSDFVPDQAQNKVAETKDNTNKT